MLLNTSKSLSITLAAALVFAFTACDDSSTGPENELQVETYTATDISADTANTGEYTFFSLRENEIVEDSTSTKWDIALDGTTIRFNNRNSGPGDGGALLLDIAFEDVTIAPSEGYKVDTPDSLAIPTGGGNGWYNYTGREGNPPHAILPIENRTIVLKTGSGQHYAKLRIISYYKGNPDTSTDEFASMQTRPPSSFYTFEYTIQLNESREFTE